MTGADLTGLLGESLTRPRAAARRAIDMAVPSRVLLELLVLTAVLGDLLFVGGFLATPEGRDLLSASNVPGPLALAVVQMFVLIGLTLAIHGIGRLFGGVGDWDGALTVMVLLQGVMLSLQFGQLVLALLIPPLGELLGIGALVLFFWLVTNFIAELHGFTRLVLVFISTLIAFTLLIFILIFILVAFGFVVPGAI